MIWWRFELSIPWKFYLEILPPYDANPAIYGSNIKKLNHRLLVNRMVVPYKAT
jgi:hypothetical protein